MALISRVWDSILNKNTNPFVEEKFFKNWGIDTGYQTSTNPYKSVEKHLIRIHKKYPELKTVNIEKLVYKILNNKNSIFLDLVKDKTQLKDTFFNRIFKVKTSLGNVLQELQNSQESPNRKLLAKNIIDQAEIEAEKLLESNLSENIGKEKTLSKVFKNFFVTSMQTFVSYSRSHKITNVINTGLMILGINRYSPRFAKPLFMSAGSLFGAKAQPICLSLAGSMATSGYSKAVYVEGNYAYIGNVGSFQIADIRNKTNPKAVGQCNFTPSQARGVFVLGNYAYMTYDNDLYVIDISNKANPVVVGSILNSYAAYDAKASGNYAYVINDQTGLRAVDISNKLNPRVISNYVTGNSPLGVALDGNYTYVVTYQNYRLLIIDVSNPASLGLAGSYSFAGICRPSDVAVLNGYAFVACEGYFKIFDVRNVANPILISTYPGSCFRVFVVNSRAYIVDWGGKEFIVFDISNKGNPILLDRYGISNYAEDVAVLGNYAYVVDGNLQIFDISCLLTSSSTSSSSTTTSSSTTSSTSISSMSSTTSSSTSTTISSTASSLSTISSISSVSSIITSTNPIETSHIGIDSTSNPRYIKIILGIGIAVIVCCGASVGLLYILKRRQRSAPLDDDIANIEGASFELSPTLKISYKEIGGEYLWMSKIGRKEAEDIYKQTGHLIVIPENRTTVRYGVGQGHFGKTKIGKRIKDGEYVAIKKVKEKYMQVSKEEAQMQKDAAGENILPIYNTVVFENVMYHFMPLAVGNGVNIQKQLSSVRDKLAQEIIKYVAADVLRGLLNIHNKGVYHLDLKADNIVFMRDGTAFIIDFGSAKKAKMSPETIGNKYYFSPDRLSASLFKEEFDAEKADLWAAGMMLLTMYKNKSVTDLFNFPSDSEIAKWNKEDIFKFFQDELNKIDELADPRVGNIWWVIKNLLDPNEKTSFTAKEALDSACFKGLSEHIKAKLFMEIRSKHLIDGANANRDIDIGDYGFVNKIKSLKEQNKIDEMRDLLDRYELVSERVTEEDVKSKRNSEYQFSPDKNRVFEDTVRKGENSEYQFSV